MIAPVVARPPAAAVGIGVFYDGKTNRKRVVDLALGADRLDISESGALIASWPCIEIRRADSPPDILRVSATGAPELARLDIPRGPLADALQTRAPYLDVDEQATRRSTARIVLWSMAAAASIIAVTIFGMPLVADRLAPLVPASFERRVGEAVDKQVRVIFGGKVCADENGRAALLKLVGKLESQAQGKFNFPLQADALDLAVANAIALPGGKVYVFKGLIDRAESPDELAGVLSHELGHVAHRDGMRRMIQAGGSSFLFGLLFGDVAGAGAIIFATRSLVDASYSREAESAADGFAIETMLGLGRSPKPLGDLLIRITGAQRNAPLSMFASHPLTGDRLARVARFDGPATGAPLLTDDEWRALKSICATTR